MKDDEFGKLVDEAIDSIPREFLDKLENVTVLVEDFPTAHKIAKIRKKGRGGLPLGLYEGVPKTKRGQYGIGGTLPDKITIFKRSIEAMSRSADEVKRIVQDTVKHEIAHHFGMDEQQIHKALLNKKKNAKKI